VFGAVGSVALGGVVGLGVDFGRGGSLGERGRPKDRVAVASAGFQHICE
jgi:hypothetical protein